MLSIVSMIQISAENNPYMLGYGYLAISLVTFCIYYFDKFASLNGRWRVPENSLHLLAVFGGWPGAMLGQRILRHKTVKQPFRRIFWLTVMINCVVILVFLFPENIYRIFNQVIHYNI
jgi:uncharacterized membrane protein YsdA (DUF1294 family)